MFICPDCRSVYNENLPHCERDQEKLVPVRANQNHRKYPLLNQELDGRYHLIGGLGQGGVGTVYLANHIHLSQLSAVKFLDIEHLMGSDDEQKKEALDDFLREAKLAMMLRHDLVVRVMDFGVFEDSPFLVMEYIPGPSLLRRMNSSERLTIPQALSVIHKIAEALNAFHERKLVHRDLKPANVILDPRDNGQLTLVDLGLVKDLSNEARSSTHPLAMRGTPGYLAPEQVPSWVLSTAGAKATTEKQPVDERIDIFALGVIAYELLAGQPPYPKGLSPNKVIVHTCTQDPPRVEQHNPEVLQYPGLSELVYSMMARVPSQRPNNGAAVVQIIEEISAESQGVGSPKLLQEEIHRAQQALVQQFGAGQIPQNNHRAPAPSLIAPPAHVDERSPEIKQQQLQAAESQMQPAPYNQQATHQLPVSGDAHTPAVTGTPNLPTPTPYPSIQPSAPLTQSPINPQQGINQQGINQQGIHSQLPPSIITSAPPSASSTPRYHPHSNDLHSTDDRTAEQDQDSWNEKDITRISNLDPAQYLKEEEESQIPVFTLILLGLIVLIVLWIFIPSDPPNKAQSTQVKGNSQTQSLTSQQAQKRLSSSLSSSRAQSTPVINRDDALNPAQKANQGKNKEELHQNEHSRLTNTMPSPSAELPDNLGTPVFEPDPKPIEKQAPANTANDRVKIVNEPIQTVNRPKSIKVVSTAPQKVRTKKRPKRRVKAKAKKRSNPSRFTERKKASSYKKSVKESHKKRLRALSYNFKRINEETKDKDIKKLIRFAQEISDELPRKSEEYGEAIAILSELKRKLQDK